MKKHLESEWDTDNDGSLDLTEPQSADPLARRNRRERKAEDGGDEEEN